MGPSLLSFLRSETDKEGHQKQSDILESMDSRIGEISKTTKLLPEPQAKQFIEAAKAEQVAAVSKALEDKKQSAPLNQSRWGMS